MVAKLIRYEKFILDRRYIIEISVHEIVVPDRYIDGLKWGMICVDQWTGSRVIMDNHHPKGPHIHLDQDEISYEFRDLDQLIEDFRQLIKKHMGVHI